MDVVETTRTTLWTSCARWGDSDKGVDIVSVLQDSPNETPHLLYMGLVGHVTKIIIRRNPGATTVNILDPSVTGSNRRSGFTTRGGPSFVLLVVLILFSLSRSLFGIRFLSDSKLSSRVTLNIRFVVMGLYIYSFPKFVC